MTKFLLTCCAVIPLYIITFLHVHAQVISPSANQHYAKQIYPELIKIRRNLFAHPEPSGNEKYTAQVVENYLKNIGLDVKTNIGGYGVVGVLTGDKPGKGIVWRADMDAAKFQYHDSNHPKDTVPEVAHVCGHDVHTTIALGIANTLAKKRNQLSGTVYFLFQPAEETQQGAKAMIKDGVFDFIEADEVYGLHVASMPTGFISSTSGNVFAHSRRLNIAFNGSHSNELNAMIKKTLTSLTRVNSPSAFVNLLNLTDPNLGLENPKTIYRDYVMFDSLHHSTDNEVTHFTTELITSDLEQINDAVVKLKQQIKIGPYKTQFKSLSLTHEREGVNNSQELLEKAKTTFRTHFGENVFLNNYGKVPFASEDFGHFQKIVPGVYFLIGVANKEKGNVAFPHMPGFEVDEMAIYHGVSQFSTLLEQRLTD